MNTIVDRLQRLAKFRFAVLYPIAIYLLVFGSIDKRAFSPGLIVMALGILCRLWSNCYVIKMGRLTTSGPYAYVRNPLYLGTALILLGAVLMLGMYVEGVVVFALAAVVYRRTIVEEQRMLTEKFGQDFIEYMQHVPAMIPRLTAYRKGEKWPLSLERLWESREHKVVIWLMIAIIYFYLKSYYGVHPRTGAKGLVLLIMAGGLALTDLIADIVRHNVRSRQG